MPGPRGTMVVHPFSDSVVGRPGGASDAWHVEADTGLKEPRQRVTGVPGTSRLGIDRIGVDRLEIALQLIDRRLVGCQEIDLPCGIVLEPRRESQHPLGLLDLCVEVALVHDRESLPASVPLSEIEGVLADDPYRREEDPQGRRAVMGVAEEEELVDEVVAAPNPDRAREPGEHPDPFAFPESPCGVVAEPLVSDDGVQETEGLVVLDWDVAVPDDAEHVTGVVAYYSLSLRHVRAIEGDEWLDRNTVIEARGDDCFTCRGRGIKSGAKPMPGDFPGVHHRGLGIGRGEVGSNG